MDDWGDLDQSGFNDRMRSNLLKNLGRYLGWLAEEGPGDIDIGLVEQLRADVHHAKAWLAQHGATG